MSTVSYLPNIPPKNNSTAQIRRRTNDIVQTVSQQVGSIATNTGDLGALNTQLQGVDVILAPGISGTVTLAKLTGGGANGSLTFTKGIITKVVNPT